MEKKCPYCSKTMQKLKSTDGDSTVYICRRADCGKGLRVPEGIFDIS